jgi:hypothetical protein
MRGEDPHIISQCLCGNGRFWFKTGAQDIFDRRPITAMSRMENFREQNNQTKDAVSGLRPGRGHSSHRRRSVLRVGLKYRWRVCVLVCRRKQKNWQRRPLGSKIFSWREGFSLKKLSRLPGGKRLYADSDHSFEKPAGGFSFG